jgi:hypothetical protein
MRVFAPSWIDVIAAIAGFVFLPGAVFAEKRNQCRYWG